MVDTSFDADAVGKMLKKAKSQGGEFPFAFGLASKAEECGLLIHHRKPGAVLKKELKADPGIRKACFGTLRVEGDEVLLQPARPLKGIIKQLKRRLRDAGLMKFKPVLVDENGAVIDEDQLPDADQYDDSEDETDGPAAGQDANAAEPVEAADERAALLKARLVKAAGALKAISDPERLRTLGKELKLAAAAHASGDLDACAASLERIEAALADPGQSAGNARKPPADLADRVAKALREMVPALRALPPAQSGPLLKMAAQVAEHLKAGDAVAAGAALKDLARARAALPTAPAPGPETQAADQAASTAPRDPMAIWRDAKEAVDAGISALQAKLRGFNDPVLAKIADAGLNGVSDGNQSALMKALFEMNAAKGPARQAAGKALSAQIAAYLTFLKASPEIELIEKNPFGVPVAVRAPLGGALKEIAEIARAA